MHLASALILALAMSGGIPALAQAQDYAPDRAQDQKATELHIEEPARWRPGFQGGINVSNYTNNPSVNSSSYVSYAAGVQLEYRVDSIWYLQPEVRLVQKGFTYDLNPSGSATHFDVTITYIELPLLLKAKLFPGYTVQPFLFAGPNIAFNITNGVNVTSGGVQVPGPPLQALFRSYDFTADAGFGGEYHFAKRMSGFAAARASIGLVNVSDLAGTNWKSRDYQILFGAFLDL